MLAPSESALDRVHEVRTSLTVLRTNAYLIQNPARVLATTPDAFACDRLLECSVAIEEGADRIGRALAPFLRTRR